MSWNYRIIRTSSPSYPEDDMYVVHEVYYDNKAKITMYSADAMSAGGNTLDELRADLMHMLEALDKPILNKQDMPK